MDCHSFVSICRASRLLCNFFLQMLYYNYKKSKLNHCYQILLFMKIALLNPSHTSIPNSELQLQQIYFPFNTSLPPIGYTINNYATSSSCIRVITNEAHSTKLAMSAYTTRANNCLIIIVYLLLYQCYIKRRGYAADNFQGFLGSGLGFLGLGLGLGLGLFRDNLDQNCRTNNNGLY